MTYTLSRRSLCGMGRAFYCRRVVLCDEAELSVVEAFCATRNSTWDRPMVC